MNTRVFSQPSLLVLVVGDFKTGIGVALLFVNCFVGEAFVGVAGGSSSIVSGIVVVGAFAMDSGKYCEM